MSVDVDRLEEAHAESLRKEYAAKTPKKPRGKPFSGKGDPRNNLKGRPPMSELEREWRAALKEICWDMLPKLRADAMKGKEKARELAAAYSFGKANKIELSGPEGGPIEFTQSGQEGLKAKLGALAGQLEPKAEAKEGDGKAQAPAER